MSPVFRTSKSRGEQELRSLSGALPEVRLLATSIWDPIWGTKIHRSPDWELVHILNGEVVMKVGHQRFPARAGDTLIVPVNTDHRDCFPLDRPFEVLHVHFDWADAARALPLEINRALPRLPLVVKQVVRERMLDLQDAFRRQVPMFDAMARVTLHWALMYLVTACAEQRQPRQRGEDRASGLQRKRLVAEAKAYVREHLREPVTLERIAMALGVNPYHLSHVFSRESHFTLTSYLIRCRMERAAELLRTQPLTVHEVAYAVGFDDPGYFGKVFRRHYGVTPLQFRQGRHPAVRARISHPTQKAPIEKRRGTTENTP
jgi:AraC-like DNA-binding protein